MSHLNHWLALNRAPFIGPVNFRTILSIVDSPTELFENIDEIAKQTKLNARALSYIKNPDWHAIEEEIRWSEQENNQILTLSDPRYPKLLAEIHDAPPIIYVHGNAEQLNDPQIAIVGSRNPTPSGKDTAFEFAKHLANSGISITSGLALGIDYQSHLGALSSHHKNGNTLAVIGTGLNRVYPAKHRQLAHDIVNNNGALISEYPLDTPAKKEHFPRRNRIISGMSMGVLVVEAAQKSGSLITARFAGDHGREVFAIPGSIHNPLSKGCHSLIRQGAKLVETAEHILEELTQLNIVLNQQASDLSETSPSTSENAESLTSEQLSLLNHLSYEPCPIDTVIERSGLTPEAVSSMLLVLQLQDYVQSLPGGTYARIK